MSLNMADVKSSLFCHFDKLPELTERKFHFCEKSMRRRTVTQAFFVHRACFKSSPFHILFKKATNLIKAIRKSELTGNAHDSLYMLTYFFFFTSFYL